jgi:nickel/cobalt exporter
VKTHEKQIRFHAFAHPSPPSYRGISSFTRGLGHRPSAIGYQLSAISYQLSAIGYRLSAIGYWRLAIGDKICRSHQTALYRIVNFNEYLAQGNGWLFIPAAVILGALHGLEPGHSKTMMAAFIVSIRGTVTQAALLGLSATVSHTAIIWLLALLGLRYSKNLDVEGLEPYFKVGIGVIVIATAAWMWWRIRAQQEHKHVHGAHGGQIVDTGHGKVEISVFETNVPPRFRIYFYDAQGNPTKPAAPKSFSLSTHRGRGNIQPFTFTAHSDYLESVEEIPEPHEFEVSLEIRHGDHAHRYDVLFAEHDHHHEPIEGASPEDYEDAHQRAHAEEIKKRFANRQITTGQIILFGLTGGLLPCPSAFAVLLICLQLKKFALGFVTVLAFSLGLAITLVTVGSIAALSTHHMTKRFKGMEKFAHKAPYASAIIMAIIGIGVLIHGLKTLPQ